MACPNCGQPAYPSDGFSGVVTGFVFPRWREIQSRAHCGGDMRDFMIRGTCTRRRVLLESILGSSATALLSLVVTFILFAPTAAEAATGGSLRFTGASAQDTYRPGQPVTLRWTLTNISRSGCLASGQTDGTVVFTAVTRNGSPVHPELSTIVYDDSLDSVLNASMVRLASGKGVTISMQSAERDASAGGIQSLQTVAWSSAGADISLVWPISTPGSYAVTALYSLPRVPGLASPTCNDISSAALIRFTVAQRSTNVWLFAGVLVAGFTLIVIITVSVRRSRRRPGKAAGILGVVIFAVLAAQAGGLTHNSGVAAATPKPGAGPGPNVVVGGDKVFQNQVNDCFEIFHSSDGDPVGIVKDAENAKNTEKPGVPGISIIPQWESGRTLPGQSSTGGEGGRITIAWSTTYTDQTRKFLDGVSRERCAELYHEFSHAYDVIHHQINGLCDDLKVETTQVRAVLNENEYRLKHHLDPRKYAKGRIKLVPIEKCTTKKAKTGTSFDDCSSACAMDNGDPHISTFDGALYDFQAVGEFIATKSTTNSLEIQTRQAAWFDSTDVSVNSAVAMNVEGDRFGVYVGQSEIITRVNGSRTVLKNGITRLPGGGRISRSETVDGPVYLVTWRDGSQALVSPVASWGVGLNVTLAAARRGHVVGLLGNFDGNSRNDLVSRAGQALNNTPSFHDLYQVFGDSWRIRQSESLFDYAPDQSTAAFTNRRLPTRPVSATSVPNGQAARAICRSLGVTTPWMLQACALDVAATGQAAFADSAIAAQSRTSPRCAALSYTAPTRATMAAGTVDCYRLTVAAGDVVRLRVLSGTGNSLSGNLEMIDPRGKSVCFNGIGNSELDCTAGPAGTYTIMVSDYDNKFSGAYRVWAQRLNDPVGCAALSYTAPTRATMAAGTVDCYRLTVAAGDVVRLRVLFRAGHFLSGNLEMIDPRGKSVCFNGIGNSELDCTAGPAGTYTIMVSDYDNK